MKSKEELECSHETEVLPFTMDWDPNNFRAMVEYMDGVAFMKSMVTFLEQCHILNCGSSYTASDGKRT